MEKQQTIASFYEILQLKYAYVLSENWEKLKEISEIRHLHKNELFISMGERLRYGIFVVNGCLKLSYMDENGQERIAAFNTETEYVDNWNDIHQQTTLPYSIYANIPSTILLCPLEKMTKIFKKESDLLQLCIDLSQSMIKKKEEHYSILTLKTPIERYKYILKNRKELVNNLSITDLAKYLHLSRETLSRVRKNFLRM